MASTARSGIVGALAIAVSTTACERKRTPATEALPTVSVSVTAPEPAAPPPSGTARSTAPSKPPAAADFEGLGTENLTGAGPLGCEAQRTGDWLRLRCPVLHPKNGRLKDFTVIRGREAEQVVRSPLGGSGASHAGSDAFAELMTPYRRGTRVHVDVAWQRTRKRVELGWSSEVATPEAVGRVTSSASAAVLSACRALGSAGKAAIDEAVAKKRITAAQAALVPRGLNACRSAEIGAWALLPSAIVAATCPGGAECIELTLSVAYLDDAGRSRTANLGDPIRLQTGDISVALPVVADFDGDGKEELFVGVDSKHGAPPRLVNLWTHADGLPRPLPGAPALAWHTSEQPAGATLPLLGTFGPFVRPLPRRCGARTCPSRITGPVVFAEWQHGKLGFDGDASRTALRAACRDTGGLVARLDGVAHVQRTAHNVACRRYEKYAPQALVSQLRKGAEALCGGERKCAALSALEQLALAPMPAALQRLGSSAVK